MTLHPLEAIVTFERDSDESTEMTERFPPSVHYWEAKKPKCNARVEGVTGRRWSSYSCTLVEGHTGIHVAGNPASFMGRGGKYDDQLRVVGYWVRDPRIDP